MLVRFPRGDGKTRQELVFAKDDVRRTGAGCLQDSISSDDAFSLYPERSKEPSDVLGNVFVTAHAKGAQGSLFLAHNGMVGNGLNAHKCMFKVSYHEDAHDRHFRSASGVYITNMM